MNDTGPLSGIDRLSVAVVYGPGPVEEPTRVFRVDIDGPRFEAKGFDDQAVLRDLFELVYVASGEKDVPAPYALDEQKSITSWGADGGGINIVLYIADHSLSGALDGVVAVATKKVLDKLAKRYGGDLDRDTPFASSPKELEERARWTIESQFRDSVPDAQILRLIDETRQPSTWYGKFVDEDGTTYEVTLDAIDGYPHKQQVKRTTTK